MIDFLQTGPDGPEGFQFDSESTALIKVRTPYIASADEQYILLIVGLDISKASVGDCVPAT